MINARKVARKAMSSNGCEDAFSSASELAEDNFSAQAISDQFFDHHHVLEPGNRSAFSKGTPCKQAKLSLD